MKERTLVGTIAINIACVAFLLTGYWIYGARPLVGEPWQWADDGLYLRQAEAFVRWLSGDNAQWLGSYDPVLLSKAPMFSIWIGFLYLVNIPLRIGEFGLLMILPVLFRAAVRPLLALGGWRWALVSMILVGLPFLPHEQRLLRSALQVGLGSACLICAVGLIIRVRGVGLPIGLWAAMCGFFFSLSYINREEAIWLIPAMGGSIAAVLVGAVMVRSWRNAFYGSLGLLISFSIPVMIVRSLNYKSYGVSVTTMRRAPATTRAHQVMTSLEPADRERYVPIRTSTRLKAYAISPAFARLRAYLEGPSSDHIATNSGHLSLNGRPSGTREFFVSNFEFALRDAAFYAGAKTAPESEELFSTIERELKSAIAAGKIPAGGSGPAVMAAPLKGDYSLILARSLVSLRKLYSLESMTFPAASVSSGEIVDLQRMESVTHTIVAPTKAPLSPILPEIGGGLRRILFALATKVDFLAYSIGTMAVVLEFVLVFGRRRRDPTRLERAFAGVVLCGSLLAFSLSMAVVDVLGFPILQWATGYNSMGYIPLSVLGAFGTALLLRRRQPEALERRGTTFKP